MKKIFFSFLITLTSCKFSFSPYSVETPKILENDTQIARIQSEEAQVGASYKIAFISDTHNFYDDLADLVKAINKRGPYAFVIVAGDVTNEGLRDEYLKTKEILGKLNFPVIVVVGNHDLLANGHTLYKKIYGKTDFTLTYRDLTFVFANNNNWEAGGAVPDLAFIRDSFSSAVTPNRILVTHVSPDDGERFSSDEITALEDIITTSGVNYIFHGHNHNPSEDSFGGATQITIGAPTKRSFYELSAGAGGLGHQKISF